MKNSEKLKKLIEKLPAVESSKLNFDICFYATNETMRIATLNTPGFKLKDFDQIRLHFESRPHGVVANADGRRGDIAYEIRKE